MNRKSQTLPFFLLLFLISLLVFGGIRLADYISNKYPPESGPPTNPETSTITVPTPSNPDSANILQREPDQIFILKEIDETGPVPPPTCCPIWYDYVSNDFWYMHPDNGWMKVHFFMTSMEVHLD